MKKLFNLILSLTVLSGCASPMKTVKHANFSMKSYRKAAVMRFEGNRPSIGNSLAETFITDVMDIGFDVVERSQLKKILKEQQVGLSGIMDNETIHSVGKILGVDILVLGRYAVRKETKKTVTGRQPVYRRIGKKIIRRGVKPGRVEIDTEVIFSELSVRFVDVETGQIVISCTSKKECSAEDIGKQLSKMADSIKKNLE